MSAGRWKNSRTRATKQRQLAAAVRRKERRIELRKLRASKRAINAALRGEGE